MGNPDKVPVLLGVLALVALGFAGFLVEMASYVALWRGVFG